MDGRNAFLAHIHRRELGLLPTALPGSPRHAAPLHRLPRCFRRMEHGIVLRRILYGYSNDLLRIRCLLHTLLRTPCWRQLLERTTTIDDIGMDTLLTTAIPPIRNPTES